MRTESALDLLFHHQDGIRAHMRNALGLIDLDPEEARMPLAVARWGMVRRLRAYQLFKHSEIYYPAIRHGTPLHAERARAMLAHCMALGESFRSYTETWSSRDIVGRWQDYRPAMLEMAGQISRGIDAERAQVQELLAGCERTRNLCRWGAVERKTGIGTVALPDGASTPDHAASPAKQPGK